MNEKVKLEELSVDQLKEIKESLEKHNTQNFSISQKIKNTSGSLLDKFTSIDELIIGLTQELQNLILEQHETNRQMQITNKLLLALYFKQDGNGNIVASQPSDIQSADILREISRGGAIITRVINSLNKNVRGDYVVFEGEFEGAIAELLFVSSTDDSDNSVFGARVVADDNIIYEGTYSLFQTRSNMETDMACFEDEINEKYLLQFQNIHFQGKIKVEVYDSSANFERIYIKYHRSV